MQRTVLFATAAAVAAFAAADELAVVDAPLGLRHITCNADQAPEVARTQSCRDSVTAMLYNPPERCCNDNAEGSRCTTLYSGLEGGCALSLCGFQGCLDCSLFGHYMAAAAEHCSGPEDPAGSTLSSVSMTMDMNGASTAGSAGGDDDVRLVIEAIGGSDEDDDSKYPADRLRDEEILFLERSLLLSPDGMAMAAAARADATAEAEAEEASSLAKRGDITGFSSRITRPRYSNPTLDRLAFKEDEADAGRAAGAEWY